jgi:hypothetical protein
MDVVIVLVVIALIGAAVAAYLYIGSRTARAEHAPAPARPLTVSRPPGIQYRPLADVTAAKRTVTAPAAPTAPAKAPPVSAPPPLFDLDHEPAVIAPPVEIRWSRRFDSRSVGLDETARLRLIGDLGVVGKEWCVPLLCQAYEEERRSGHRQAALIALAACRSRLAMPTFRLALASDDPAERSIASDALADLEPPPQVKPRRIVERH